MDNISIASSKQSIKDQIADPEQLYVNITIGETAPGQTFNWPYNVKIPQHLPIDGILDIEESFIYFQDQTVQHPSFIYLLIKEATQYCNQKAQNTQIVCVFKPVHQFKNFEGGLSNLVGFIPPDPMVQGAPEQYTLYEMPHGFKKKYVQLDSKNSFNFILATYSIETNEFIKLRGRFECNLTFIVL